MVRGSFDVNERDFIHGLKCYVGTGTGLDVKKLNFFHGIKKVKGKKFLNVALALVSILTAPIFLFSLPLGKEGPGMDFFQAVAETTDKTIVIMGTTDIHGNLFPIDYYTGKEKKMGLAKIYTKVKEIRKQYKDTLLVDSGDLLQGTPLVTYFGRIDKKSVNPMIKAMNLMKYDAMGIGNHEYDYGIDNLLKASDDAKFPLLSANTSTDKPGKQLFKPYIIKEIDGVKVGIIGFTTPGVAVWSKGIVKNILEFQDIVASAKEWLPQLKKEADIIIAIPHTGLEDEKTINNTGLTENAGKALADNFPEIDVLILGHSHTEIKEMIENGVLITQPKPFGMQLAEVKLELKKIAGKWKVAEKHSETIDLKDVEADHELLADLKEEHQKALNYVNTAIGTSSAEWSAKDGRLKDTAIVDLINKVQKEATGADLSSAALFSTDSRIPAGNITIADIAGLYIYENTLSVIKITGKQLRDYLEFSAGYFNNYEAGKPLINNKMPGYNYDMVSGADYKIDISKPTGKRIIELKYKGKDITDDMSFTLALNSYRKNGGGGYEMLKNSPEIYDKLESIRDLIINYIQRKGKITPEDVFEKNWEIIPENK
jgi:2',3'-cyclic-nucleotide 2'-phosphodiesterase (5'-nucleotidase family)